jgi:hypothetical protein
MLEKKKFQNKNIFLDEVMNLQGARPPHTLRPRNDLGFDRLLHLVKQDDIGGVLEIHARSVL